VAAERNPSGQHPFRTAVQRAAVLASGGRLRPPAGHRDSPRRRPHPHRRKGHRALRRPEAENRHRQGALLEGQLGAPGRPSVRPRRPRRTARRRGRNEETSAPQTGENGGARHPQTATSASCRPHYRDEHDWINKKSGREKIKLLSFFLFAGEILSAKFLSAIAIASI